MTKRTIRLPDGRYMIFYTFEPATESAPPTDAAVSTSRGETAPRIEPAPPDGAEDDE